MGKAIGVHGFFRWYFKRLICVFPLPWKNCFLLIPFGMDGLVRMAGRVGSDLVTERVQGVHCMSERVSGVHNCASKRSFDRALHKGLALP